MESVADATRTRTARLLKALVGIGVLGLVVWLFTSGAMQKLDAHRVQREIVALGGFGPVVYILAFAILQPLGPSGHIFTVAASFIWSPPVAFLFALVGAVASQVVAFLFHRHVAHDLTRPRIPARMLAYEDKLMARPFRTIVVLRLLLFTWPLVTMLLGVSRVRFLPMLLATVVGLAPGVALDVWLGGAAVRWLTS